MNQIFKQFVIALFLFVGLAFALHLLLLNVADLPLFENKIIASYIVNIILALIIFTGLFLLRNKFKNQIGFLFMGGSFLKFFVFFLFFLPVFKEDGTTDKLEFASFFVPYAVCLLIETLGVMRLLRD
ncbi:DUF6168 family protein [Lutibacter flavus]|uniref:ATP synthase protein I n=1 Tax=Lutibacter flavus TaxID=691689 RepID=A0A238X3B8_9FLAO|nr:DUF6168 family protein [Lutibacter flavus]SNR52874.1 hypothetical protein SAMN04488111_1487 [Lutibacter flavus]